MPDMNQAAQAAKSTAQAAAGEIKSAAQQAKGDMSPVAEDLRKMVEHLREDMADLRRDMGDVAGKWQERGAKAASEAGATLKQRASEQAENLKRAWEVSRDRTKEGVERGEQCIHDHPWTSIAIALGVGLVIGKLLDRR